MIKKETPGRAHVQAGNAKFICAINKVKVTNLIRNSDGISRADLAKTSGLSAPTVSRIAEALIREGLVVEIGAGESRGGRRPTLLKFSGFDNFIIGVAWALFNPEAVFIGGGVAQAGDILFDKVRKTVNGRALNKTASDVAIVPATFGPKAAVMGAISLILSGIVNLDYEPSDFPASR